MFWRSRCEALTKSEGLFFRIKTYWWRGGICFSLPGRFALSRFPCPYVTAYLAYTGRCGLKLCRDALCGIGVRVFVVQLANLLFLFIRKRWPISVRRCSSGENPLGNLLQLPHPLAQGFWIDLVCQFIRRNRPVTLSARADPHGAIQVLQPSKKLIAEAIG